jgi:hypothetical protein
VSTAVTAVLLSGLLALVVAAGVGALMWNQLRRERERGLVTAKVARTLELHRARLASYPAALEAMAPLSTHNRALLNPEVAGDVGEDLNVWLYSTGGMCADATTRGAVIGLRDSCARWAENGQRPPQLYELRNLTVAFLRRDLELTGLEPPDVRRNLALLGKLRDDLDALGNRNSD